MASKSHPGDKSSDCCWSELKIYDFSSKEFAQIEFMLPIVEELYSKRIIDDTSRLRFTLALQEAFANALEHGNLELKSTWKEDYDSSGLDKFSIMKRDRLSDPLYAERRIRISSEVEQGVLEIVVKDQGSGFNAPILVIADPSGKPIQTHGRGIAIMLDVMDQVSYSENGTCLKMVKRINQTKNAL